MKYLLCLTIVLSLGVSAHAVTDIQFSPGGDSAGGWSYTGSTQTFSFTQDIDIDGVQGGTADALFDEFVYLPDLTLVSYSGGLGTVSSGGNVEIKDGFGNVLLAGTLTGGNFYAFGATSVIYPEIAMDIRITQIDYTFGSAFLNTLTAGMYFDLNLTLNTNKNFHTVITENDNDSDGFSGSMTLIPEPATMVLLGLGGLLLRKK
jgi:hypothetical protein